MSPEKKAKELYNKFYNTDTHPVSVETRHNVAKKHAIISVKEILDPFRKLLPSSRKYWQDVLISLEGIE